MKTSTLLALGGLLLMGCQNLREEIEPAALTGQAGKLVVVGFISPQDSLLNVKVTRSQPLGSDSGSTAAALTNATVVLKNDNVSVTLKYSAQKQFYAVEARKFPIVSGKTYTLSVQTPDGQRVSARCTVPKAAALQTPRLDSTVALDGKKQFFARYLWQDPAGEVNFYQTAGLFSYEKKCQTCRGDVAVKPETSVLSFGTASVGWIPDEGRNGATLQTSGTLALTEFPATFGGSYQRATLRAVLLHVDETYYRYHRAVEQSESYTYKSNPFAEALLIPGNIEGGLGCFAAYNRTTVVLGLR